MVSRIGDNHVMAISDQMVVNEMNSKIVVVVFGSSLMEASKPAPFGA